VIKLGISEKVAVIFLIGVRHVSDTEIKGRWEKEGRWRVVVEGDEEVEDDCPVETIEGNESPP